VINVVTKSDDDGGLCAWQYTAEQKSLDVDCLAALVLEVVPHNSCLVFCPTKKNCENVAQLICRFMPTYVGFCLYI